MGLWEHFKSLFGKEPEPEPEPPISAPFVSGTSVGGIVGNIIGGLIATAMMPYVFYIVEESSGTHFSLRSPKWSTFKLDRHKYGIIRKTNAWIVRSRNRVSLKSLGWRVVTA